ncbi:MAG: 50S ribosomal protein L35 [Chlamydiia bacterium]|nr:50S ribosomal protein L35 [Chlamydiia bacterium]
MPKQKTRKSVALRIKVTGTGKCMRRAPGVGHFLSKKSRGVKRRKTKDRAIGDTTIASKYKKMMNS